MIVMKAASPSATRKRPSSAVRQNRLHPQYADQAFSSDLSAHLLPQAEADAYNSRFAAKTGRFVDWKAGKSRPPALGHIASPEYAPRLSRLGPLLFDGILRWTENPGTPEGEHGHAEIAYYREKDDPRFGSRHTGSYLAPHGKRAATRKHSWHPVAPRRRPSSRHVPRKYSCPTPAF